MADAGQVKTIHDRVRVKEPGSGKTLVHGLVQAYESPGPFSPSRYEAGRFLSAVSTANKGDFIKSGYQADVVEDTYAASASFAPRRCLDGRVRKYYGVGGKDALL